MTPHDRLATALHEIWQIVHTPTSKTAYRSADAHYQADFDRIRKIIAATRCPQERTDG